MQRDDRIGLFEVIADMGGDLAVGHPVCGFHGHGKVFGHGMFEFLDQLTLGLARAENQQ